MLLTLKAGNALEVAYEVVKRTPETLSGTAQKFYKALVAAAVETGRGRGYSLATTHVTMHLPLEILAAECGVSRVSAWRHLPALRELGLVDYRTHKGACRGETRNTGTLWCVRLNPVSGSKARLSYDDMKHRWRDLDRDVRRGRTSYAALKHTRNPSSDELDISRLLEWTLTPNTQQNPNTSVCFRSARVDLEAVLDVRYAAKDDRNQVVRLAAEALATALADQSGVDWYQKLLWQLLRRSDATGEDYSYQVYLAAQRAQVDRAEGFARVPGALFTSRIKAAPWFDEVMRSPMTRVGTRPN
jgi:hypothetical protein